MRILVVEDHADTVDVVQRMLKKDGYNVTAALTLADATTACREGKFDLLICDIGLPDGDGWGLAEMGANMRDKSDRVHRIWDAIRCGEGASRWFCRTSTQARTSRRSESHDRGGYESGENGRF